MTVLSKFGAQSVWFCPQTKVETSKKTLDSQEYFPSKFELRVYKELLSIDKLTIDRQVHVSIKPAGEFFAALKWRCDFWIKLHDSNRDFYIEVKGAVTPEFRLQMMMLEQNNLSVFKKLIIVSNNPIKLSPIELKLHQLRPIIDALRP